jgi:dolichol-phosphate mannosyltransferase
LTILVILPTYNECENIVRMIEAIRVNLPDAEILVVDDSSPDGTGELVQGEAGRLGKVHLLTRAEKNGLGPAYLAGFSWGFERGFEAMVEMDSDFQHDPTDLPALVLPLGAGYDLVIGSRYVQGGEIPDWAPLRRLISRAGNLWADFALALGVNDSTAGFRAYRADLLARMDLATVRARGYGFQIEMTSRAHDADARIKEVPIRFHEREHGSSKMSIHTVVEAFVLVGWWGIRRISRSASA